MKRVPRVGLLIETSNNYARELLHGIRAYIREHRPWSIHLTERSRGQTAPSWLNRWDGDGLIARLENRQIARAVRATGLPVVDVSAALPGVEFMRVATDSRMVSRMAVEHLVERGLRNLAFCGETGRHWSEIRCEAFCERLKEAGIGGHMLELPQERRWEAQQRQLVRWIMALPKPVGIMASYDVIGRQVLEACQQAGITVPDQAAVIGVHNDELLCDLCSPPLSSVVPNARRAGYEAAALLERMMDGERLRPRFVAIPPAGVVTRQSTDVIAVSDPAVTEAVRIIRTRATAGIGVEDVVQEVAISRSSLERRFHRALRCTPHDLLLRTRIEHVQHLLATTQLGLTAIAHRAGFAHVEYLSVAFKRVVGEPPSVYRARLRA